MSYEKSDFILMKNTGGGETLVNISKVKFVVQEPMSKNCRLFFGGGEEDYISVKYTIDELVELL